MVFLASVVSLAAALGLLEQAFPSPFPWLRLGLANAAGLLVLLTVGIPEAFLVTLVRIFLVAALSGTLMGPGFLLSLGGGLAGMGCAALLVPWRVFGPCGLSAAGAFVHMAVQFLLASLLIGSPAVLRGAPPFLLLALAAGWGVGWLVLTVIRTLPLPPDPGDPDRGP
jgi:heptaprenyl diphosphate synthase